MTFLAEIFPVRFGGYWGLAPGQADLDARAIRNGDVGTSGSIDWVGLPTRAFTAREASKAVVKSGDILLTTSGNCGNVAFVESEPEVPTLATNFVRVLRVDPARTHAKFAFHYLRTRRFREEIAPFVRGATIKNLSVESAFEALEMPSPPLTEQRRIAAILDRADALSARRREAIALLDRLVEAIYEFGIAANASTYPVEAFADLTSDTQLGLVRSAALQGPDRDYDYLRMDSITRTGGLDLSSITRVDAPAAEAAKYEVREGDLLFNTRNTRELVGKTVVYRGGPRLFNNNLMRIRFNDRVVPEYVHRYLWSNPGKQQLEARKSGTTSVFAIYAKSLASLKVPVPPLGLQREFAAQLASVDAQRRAMQSALQRENELFASLQSQAFRGEL